VHRLEIDELHEGNGGDLIASNRGPAIRDLESRWRRGIELNLDASFPLCRIRRDVGAESFGDDESKSIESTLVSRALEIVEVEL
jgi:hypothetical protein